MFTALMLVTVLGAAPAEAAPAAEPPKLVKVACPACEGRGTDATKPAIMVKGFDGSMERGQPPCERCRGNGKVEVTPTEAKILIIKAQMAKAVRAEAKMRESVLVAVDDRGRALYTKKADEQKAKIAELEAELKKLETPPTIDAQVADAEAKVKRLEAELTTAKAELDALKAKKPEGK